MAFPPVQPGGSLIIAWQVKDKRVLLVGGGFVASSRLEHLLNADALVTLIAPRPSLHPQVAHRISDEATRHRITFHDRTFAGPDDLAGVEMVLTAIDDVQVSREICIMARERRIPVNVADVPPECDFYFGSMIRWGSLQVMVSTGGKGPKLASMIRKMIEEAIPSNVGDAIERVGFLREELRKRAPGVGGELGQRRMNWMVKVCETWSLKELGQLDDELVAKLLDNGWDRGGTVPTLRELKLGSLPEASRMGWSNPISTAGSVVSSSDSLRGFAGGVLATITLLWLARGWSR